MKSLISKLVIGLFFAVLLVALFVFSGCSKATQKAAAPAEEKEVGNFLTTKTILQFGSKEFFATLPTSLVLTKVETGGVDSLIVPDDTVRCVPQKSGTVLVYADHTAPTSAFSYGPDAGGKYVLLGRPSAVKGSPSTLSYEGKDWALLSGGEGILITPRGSTKILPGWKPKSNPPKKN